MREFKDEKKNSIKNIEKSSLLDLYGFASNSKKYWNFSVLNKTCKNHEQHIKNKKFVLG
jgi:hypothetical protein